MGTTRMKEKVGTPMVNARPGQASRPINGAIACKFEALAEAALVWRHQRNPRHPCSPCHWSVQCLKVATCLETWCNFERLVMTIQYLSHRGTSHWLSIFQIHMWFALNWWIFARWGFKTSTHCVMEEFILLGLDTRCNFWRQIMLLL